MGAAERFVRIEVHHVGAEIAGAGDAQDGVHVGAVEVEQSALLVHEVGDLPDLAFEQAQRVGIGDHEHGGVAAELGFQILQIDKALRRAANCDGLKAGHGRTGGIGAVGAIRGEHFGALFAANRGSRRRRP